MNKWILLLPLFLGLSQLNAQEIMIRKFYNKESFAQVGSSFDRNQKALFVTYGCVRKLGWYGKFKTNLNFKEDNSQELSELKPVDLIFWNGKYSKGRISGTGGAIWRLNDFCFPYIGCGYGKRWVIWETANGTKSKISEYSYQGLESEAGVIIRYNRFLLSGGLSLNNASHLEINLGTGLSF